MLSVVGFALLTIFQNLVGVVNLMVQSERVVERVEPR